MILLTAALFTALTVSASIQLMGCDSLPGWIGFADIPLLLIFLLPLILICKEHLRRNPVQMSPASHSRLNTVLMGTVIVSALASLTFFLYMAADHPHGDWDAWAIWNLHARFIYRSGADWSAYLSPMLSWSHPDYPLMLPVAVARLWALSGRESTVVPLLIAFGFTFATPALIILALRSLRSSFSALLGAILILGTPVFVVHGASQYADIPLAFYYLAAVMLLAFRDCSQNKRACLYSAFTFAGCTAWTKNEGLLFLLVLAASHLAVTFKRSGIRQCLQDGMVILAAAASFLMLVAALNRLAPDNKIVSSMGMSLKAALFDFSRYGSIVKVWAIETFRFNNGLAVLAMLALAAFGKRHLAKSPAAQTGLLTLALMWLGFFSVFLLTPYDLDWHLATAMDRLVTQLWPTTVFVILLAFDLTPSEDRNPASRAEDTSRLSA